MRKRAEKVNDSGERYTREEIEKLPEPLQRYCNYIGMEGFEKYRVARIYFKNTDFVFDDKSGKVLDMDYDLWHFYDEWYRSAYCQSSMYGIPFDGMDYCTEDFEGGMKGTIGKMIQLFDVHTKQGYQAREQNGILQAKIVRSVKEYPDKEVVYFSSDHYEIEYVK